MWAAFTSKVWGWVYGYVIKYIVRYLVDYFTAWVERRTAAAKQKKKDEASKKTYDQAVKYGTEEDIVKATEDRLNG